MAVRSLLLRLPPGAVPAGVTALAVLASLALSQALAFGDGALRLAWLPPSVALVAVLSRGPSMALPAAAVVVAWQLARGDPSAAAWTGLATALAPLAAARVLAALDARRPTASQFAMTSRLLLVVNGVLAPLAAVLDLQGGVFGTLLEPGTSWTRLAEAFAIEAMSATFAVRALLTLAPDRAGGFCPIEAARSGAAGLSRAEWTAWAVLGGGAALAAAAGAAGQSPVARLALVVAYSAAVIGALAGNRRNTSLMLLAATLATLWLRGRVEPFSLDPAYLTNLAQHVALTWLGAAMAHLLNATSSERIASERRLREQAMSNELSGLPNLRAFERHLADCGRDARCADAQLVEVGIADLGRAADLAGRTAASRLERDAGLALRDAFGADAAFVAHIGAGRFALVIPGRSADEALLARVRDAVERQPIEVDGQRVDVRAITGVVDVGTASGRDPEALLAAMSLATQKAVERPDRFHRLQLTDGLVDDYRDQLRRMACVRDAIRRGRVRLLAQPIVPAGGDGDGRMHYEVLARLLDAEGRDLPPAEFLPVLSHLRLMQAFDRLVVDRTLARLAADAALREATACCAINLTGPSMADPTLPGFVLGRLAELGLDPRLITLEITESESISSLETAAQNTARLRRAGVGFALDDFGTGLASFDYLRRFAPEWVKIDGSFVRSVDDGPLGRQIVDSIVRVAHAAGARTVAECVETPGLATRMTGLGADFLQGWGIARPMPVETLVAWHRFARPAARAGAAPPAGGPQRLAGAPPAPVAPA